MVSDERSQHSQAWLLLSIDFNYGEVRLMYDRIFSSLGKEQGGFEVKERGKSKVRCANAALLLPMGKR